MSRCAEGGCKANLWPFGRLARVTLSCRRRSVERRCFEQIGGAGSANGRGAKLVGRGETEVGLVAVVAVAEVRSAMGGVRKSRGR